MEIPAQLPGVVTLDDDVLATLERNRRTTPREFVGILERRHGGPGVDRAVVDAYLDALESDPATDVDAAGFLENLAEHTADGDRWVDAESVYRLDGDRLSTFPGRWHDELGDTTELAEYVRFIASEEPAFETGAAGGGVPEGVLLDAVEVVGGLDHGEARARLQAGRDAGDLAEDADQHPDARVYLAEWDEERRDDVLDP